MCGDDVQYASSSNCAGVQYLVYVSFAEIYNEYVYDLFEPPPMGGKAKRRTTLKLSEDRNGNIYVKGSVFIFFLPLFDAFFYFVVFNAFLFSFFCRIDGNQCGIYGRSFKVVGCWSKEFTFCVNEI